MGVEEFDSEGAGAHPASDMKVWVEFFNECPLSGDLCETYVRLVERKQIERELLTQESQLDQVQALLSPW